MKGIAVALTLGLTIALGVGQASAVTYQVTYEGTISTGYDYTGRFGPALTDLTGESVTATYVFNTTTGAYYDTSPGYQQLYGGTAWGVPGPVVSFTVTVNGVTVNIPSGNYEYTFGYFGPAGNYNDYYAEAGDGTNYGHFRVWSSVNSFGSGPDLYSPFSYLVASGDNEYGTFQLAGGDYGYVDVTSVTVGPVSEVPLPAALPLFLGGVGAIALVARRRKQKLQAAA